MTCYQVRGVHKSTGIIHPSRSRGARGTVQPCKEPSHPWGTNSLQQGQQGSIPQQCSPTACVVDQIFLRMKGSRNYIQCMFDNSVYIGLLAKDLVYTAGLTWRVLIRTTSIIRAYTRLPAKLYQHPRPGPAAGDPRGCMTYSKKETHHRAISGRVARSRTRSLSPKKAEFQKELPTN